MEPAQTLWKAVEKLWDQALAQKSYIEKKRFIFLKYKEYSTYLSATPEVHGAHIQISGNPNNDGISIYYIYILVPKKEHGPNVYAYLGFDQYNESTFPEQMNMNYFEVDTTTNVCKIRNDIPGPTPEEARTFVENIGLPYLAQCKPITVAPPAELKLLDEFIQKQ